MVLQRVISFPHHVRYSVIIHLRPHSRQKILQIKATICAALQKVVRLSTAKAVKAGLALSPSSSSHPLTRRRAGKMCQTSFVLLLAFEPS